MADDQKESGVRVVDRRWWARGESAEPSDDVVRRPKVVEDLEQRLAEATAQLQSVLGEHRRAAEEFERVRQRMRGESAREVERGRRAVLVEMLEVLDNLDRAVSAARGAEASTGTLLAGIELVRAQFLAKLRTFGVAPVPTLGEPFDPVRHEAVSTLTVGDAMNAGLIVDVIKEGYAIGEELLRPACVVVGVAASQPPGAV